MFRPNVSCTIQKRTGRDAYGQEVMGSVSNERCCVVQLRRVATPTTVRADSSASRGHGEELVAYNRFLLASTTVAAVDDKIVIAGQALRIIDMHPRFNLAGSIDHWECEGRVWS